MKPLIQSTTTPIGYTAASFNVWQRYIQRQIDKIRNTNVGDKYLVR